MELMGRIWREWVGPFLAACAFRVGLAFDVLAGRVPRVSPRRWWTRSVETPLLVEAYDWTDERLLFSVLVWPALEEPATDSYHLQRERTRQVLEVLHRGAGELAWSTRYDVHDGLVWDDERQVWAGPDAFPYDGARLFGYSRGGEVGGAA